VELINCTVAGETRGLAMSAQHQDEWLMAKVAAGDRAQLEVLVRRYATPLMTFLRRMVFDVHRSEELFQEVFLAVWKHRSRYMSGKPFRPWLFRIALNKCREDGRGRMRRWAAGLEPAPAEVVIAREPSPAEAAITAESATLVLEAIDQLPAQQRAVLVLRVWNELPFQEIADTLECTPGTARSHMHHALTVLRRHLERKMR
jgi:RNA polymerase sigma-70 factor, ECF subfamily